MPSIGIVLTHCEHNVSEEQQRNECFLLATISLQVYYGQAGPRCNRARSLYAIYFSEAQLRVTECSLLLHFLMFVSIDGGRREITLPILDASSIAEKDALIY